MVAIVKVVRFGLDRAGHGNSGPHDNIAIGGELDHFHRVFRSLGGTKDAADNALMVENSAFGHSSHPPLKNVERTGTNRNCLKILYQIATSGAIGKCG
jgi:hypothetical protein